MSVAEIDFIYEEIMLSMEREALRKVKRVLDKARDTGRISPVVFRGLNQDIRNRADWLRNRGK